jgi:ABC-2 type transport system ATP-binding protein
MLQAIGVSKQYAGHRALDWVSISLPTGSIFGLLGPNGAGKTTLIRIINRIIGPDAGEVLIDGERLAARHVEQMGYLPEERGLYRKMKIGEQVTYLARLKGLSNKEAQEKIRYWFDKFELTPWAHRKAEELSKGMQQKVQFIVTVLHEPKLIVLDEPFSGFDPINTELIKSEILRLKKQGTTILFSSHRMESVEELCDHIGLIHNSHTVLEGRVKDVKEKFRSNSYHLRMGGGKLSGPENPQGLSYTVESETLLEDGVVDYVVKLRQDSPNELLQNAMKSGKILQFNETLPSVHEIFIRLIKGEKK